MKRVDRTNTMPKSVNNIKLKKPSIQILSEQNLQPFDNASGS